MSHNNYIRNVDSILFVYDIDFLFIYPRYAPVLPSVRPSDPFSLPLYSSQYSTYSNQVM